MQGFMERVADFARKGTEGVAACGKAVSDKIAEATTEHVVPFFQHYAPGAVTSTRATVANVRETSRAVKAWPCMQLRDPDAVVVPDEGQLSFEDLLAVIKMHSQKLPLVGQVLISLTLLQGGLAANGIVNGLIRELVRNMGKKRVAAVLLPIYSILALAGHHFHEALFKHVRKALTHDGPREAGVILVRNATRMPSGFWLSILPGCALGVDIVEFWVITFLKKAIRMPIKLRHVVVVFALALAAGQARRNQAVCDRVRDIYGKVVKACCNDEETTGPAVVQKAAPEPLPK